MNQKKIIASPSRTDSIGFAMNGIQRFFREEPNARIHLLATVTVCILAGCLHVSSTEWCLLILAMGLVWTMEILNTAIERIMDFISTTHDTRIKVIKDLAAAAVLLSAAIAAAIGLIVFIPKII